jgi:hypothetical protein
MRAVRCELCFRIRIKSQLFCCVFTDITRTLRHGGCSRTTEQKSTWHQCYTTYSQLWVRRRIKYFMHQENPGFVRQNLRHSHHIFWDITPSSPLKFNRRFRGIWRLYLQKPAWSRVLTATCFKLVSCLPYSWTLKVEATCYSETTVDFQWNTRLYIPGDRTLHNHCSKNLKSYNIDNILLCRS